MKIYGDKRSGNCLKVLCTAKYLGLQYEWIDVDITKGESRTPAALSRNPVGQVPCIKIDSGETLSQSNAIVLYLARDSQLLPADPWLQAKVHQWMFWEQYNHEPYIAVCRFQLIYLKRPIESLDPDKVRRGNEALDLMESTLRSRDWMVGEAFSVADIALWAYTRLAHEGGFELDGRTRISNWVTRIDSLLEPPK